MKEPRDACSECGATGMTVSVVDDDGNRRCGACLLGRTALERKQQPGTVSPAPEQP